MKKSDKHYVIVVDQDRNTILTAAFNLIFSSNNTHDIFKDFLKRNDLEEQFKSFFDEKNDKCHACYFCKDPLCSYDYEKSKKDN